MIILRSASTNRRCCIKTRKARQEAWRQAQHALREQERLYRLVTDHATDVIILMDLHGVPQYVSPSSLPVTGYAPDEFMRFGPYEILTVIAPEDREIVGDALRQLAAGVPHLTVTYRVKRKSGEYFWGEAHATLVLDSFGNPAQILLTARDITERQRFEEQLAYQAFHDSLTGLPNRACFLDRLGEVLNRAKARKTQLAVLFLDLDGFKVINDSLGHAAGDRLLVEAGQRLQGCVRHEDMLARLSGDEFTVLLEPVNGTGDALRVADRVRAKLSRPFTIEGREVFVSASVGVVVAAPGQYAEPGKLLRDADVAMYRAKAQGHGHCEVFDSSMNRASLERLELVTDLRYAVERDELVLHYQPLVDLHTGRITGVEPLVRWNHPRRGLLGPSAFIGLAEETGLIIPIGRWVAQQAVVQLGEWHARYRLPEGFYVSINVSARQFQSPEVLTRAEALVRSLGLPPACVQFEITESAVMSDPERAQRLLTEAKRLGVRLALDDFGTGYSSLNYLKRFPIDVLKVDRTFVAGQDPADEAILQAIAGIGKALGLELVAEGIERADQVARLRDLGCAQGQGYLFARPMPATDIEALLESRTGWIHLVTSQSTVAP